MLHNQRCLAALKPRVNLAVLLLALMASSRRLSVPRRRSAANALLLMNRPLVVREAAEDGG